MPTTKYISVLSLARLHAVVLGFVGIVCGILYSFGGFAIDALVTLGWITSTETPGLSYGTILAFGALIGMPLLFGIVGWVTGGIIAIIYNLISKWFGGIDMDFKQ